MIAPIVKDRNYNWGRHTFLNRSQTFQHLLSHKQSFIRFGDGEFKIMYGSDISFQQHHPVLRKELDQILRHYTPDSPYLIGMPFQLQWSYDQLKETDKLGVWQRGKMLMKYFLQENCIYGDAFLFRPSGLPDDIPMAAEKISQLWKKNK